MKARGLRIWVKFGGIIARWAIIAGVLRDLACAADRAKACVVRSRGFGVTSGQTWGSSIGVSYGPLCCPIALYVILLSRVSLAYSSCCWLSEKWISSSSNITVFYGGILDVIVVWTTFLVICIECLNVRVAYVLWCLIASFHFCVLWTPVLLARTRNEPTLEFIAWSLMSLASDGLCVFVFRVIREWLLWTTLIQMKNSNSLWLLLRARLDSILSHLLKKMELE